MLSHVSRGVECSMKSVTRHVQDGMADRSHGHCKGAVGKDTTDGSIVHVVHSIPNYPYPFTNSDISEPYYIHF